MSNKNVLYVEPNYTSSIEKDSVFDDNGTVCLTHDTKLYDIAPPMEDYCITVDLQVEIKSRKSSFYESDDKKFLFTWSTKPNDGKGSASFFEGKTLKLSSENSVNYLTTDPTTFGTYYDAINEGTNECFGINSINIEYNNYMVPEITIEFTDIRGISLFAPEELRHTGFSNGYGGKIVDDVAGSFFKCFFTFPYPVFKLMIKGFYGEPTSYELCCSDFRAKFDCNTGNFGATAKFIGYAFSLLNDVTLNALVVAPYSDYIGKKYWENNLAKRFVFDNKKPMITIIEIMTKIKKLKESLTKLSQNDTDAINLKNLSKSNESIEKISASYDSYFETIITYLNEHYDDKEIERKLKINRDIKCFALYTDNKDEKIKDYGESEYQRLVSDIKESSALLNLPKPQKVKLLFSEINDSNVPILKKLKIYPKNLYDNKYVYYYDGSSLNSKLNDAKKINANKTKSTEDNIAKKEKGVIENALGFDPNVENITKLLMAHLETLIHCIYYASNEANKSNRTASEIGLGTTDLNIKDDIVPPFPRVDIIKNVNKIDVKTEGWLGDLRGANKEAEVSLINGLLKGTNETASIVLEAKSEIESINSDSITTSMNIPVCPIDIFLDKNPFGHEFSSTNVSDLAGKIGLRMFTIFGLNKECNKSVGDISKIGKADAINFINSFRNSPTSRSFIERLNNGTINKNLIINILLNKATDEKIGGKWIWDGNNDKSESLMSLYTSYWKYSLYENREDSNRKVILPVQNFNWENIIKDLSNNCNNNSNNEINYNNNSYKEDYFSTSSISKNDDISNYILKIDLDYKKYEKYKSLMKVDEEEFSYVDSLNLEFNASDYLGNFFSNETRQFAKTFKASADDENIDFEDNGKVNFLFPSNRPKSYSNVKDSKAFSSGVGFDPDFESITDTSFTGIGMKYFKRKTDSFTSASDEIDNVNTFTIPTFGGILDGNYTNKVSIFGQREYYSVDDNTKSFLFLFTFANFENSLFGINLNGCIEIDDIQDFLLDDSKSFCYIPYMGILLIGGYLYHMSKGINNFCFKNGEHILNKFNSKLLNLRDGLKQILVKEFIDWTNSSNGFGYVKSNFELSGHLYKNQIDYINEMIQIFGISNNFSTFNLNVFKYKGNIENFEHYIRENEDNNFYANYISIAKTNYGIKLFNRETSSAVNYLSNLLIKPCMVSKPTKYIFNNSNKDIFVSKTCINYISAFIDKLKDYYKESAEKGEEPNLISAPNSNYNIKNSLYKYIKILWDRWLSGSKEDEWNLDNFYSNNWFFIDSFYNKIGKDIRINIINFCGDVLYSQSETSYSLLSFLSKNYAKNRLALHCVQNFIDLTSGTVGARKMSNLFKPIPYNEIDYDNIDRHPSFVIMYTNEYSSKLDIENGEFKNDSFDISSDGEDLPIPITSKTETSGYKIPAFGVSYGRQYQSYFKNIDISMDSPIVTEQSIKAQFAIASMNGTKGENGKNIVTLGQDLYTIYSNNSYTCKVTMMGCAWIQPLMYFQLLNVPMFRGAYLIQKVSHRITPGNMETTFVGTRMANTSTAKVDDEYIRKINDETSPEERIKKEEYENENADILNNCKYRFYNPLIQGGEAVMEENVLNMTLKTYQEYVHRDFDNIVTATTNGMSLESNTICDLIASVINAEAKGEDELGQQLIANVLFNRWMDNGKDLTRVIYGKQHSIERTEDSKYRNIAKEIFMQSPAILIGKEAKSTLSNGNRVPIWDKGVKLMSYTENKIITEHDVKSIDGYCTTNGYYALDENKKGDNATESFGWWQRAKYSFHHKGHVFVSGYREYDKEHWNNTLSKDSINNDGDVNPLVYQLFESISKTLKTSKMTSLSKIKMEVDKGNRDSFYILRDDNEKDVVILANVFDVAINTYYNYVNEVNWIYKLDASSLPDKIRIVVSKDGDKDKSFAVSEMIGNSVENIRKYEGLNDYFYAILRKHYGDINEDNKYKFIMECKNFTSIQDKNNDWANKANNIIKRNIKECGAPLNDSTTDSYGYSWRGSGKGSDLYKNAKKFENFSIDNMVKYLNNTDNCLDNYSEEKCGKCAAKVRKALEEGVGKKIETPESACAYVNFLPKWGFTEVYSGYSPITDGYTKEEGDIAVIAGMEKGKVHGHIQVYSDTRKGWCSDYVGHNVYCYTKDSGRPFKVFRWINKNNA